MKYTVRFAHLEEVPQLRLGDVVHRGDQIGVMGNTGASNGAHLHLDVVHGAQAGRYNLEDIAGGHPEPAPKQAVLFVDEELFRIAPIVTTHYADPDYYRQRAKLHCGYDLVPEDRHASKEHFAIRWNRSAPGVIVRIMSGDPGYGNCVQVAYET